MEFHAEILCRPASLVRQRVLCLPAMAVDLAAAAPGRTRPTRTATSSGCASRLPGTPPRPVPPRRFVRSSSRARSATARIIRDELTAGTTAMLGAAIPVGQQGVAEGAHRHRHAGELGRDTRPRLAGRAGQGWSGRLPHSQRADRQSPGDRDRLRRRDRRALRRLSLPAPARRPRSRSIGSTSRSARRCSSACSTTGTTWMGPSSAATPGRSLWQWNELPGTMSPRYVDYARANASIGINGTVINSVNANVLILTPDYLVKVAALADLWRPYGLRMYLSAELRRADPARRPEDGRPARPGRRSRGGRPRPRRSTS